MAVGVACANPNITTPDFAIATTGIAGPSGGSDQHPVGTVVIAVKAQQKIYCQKINITATRSRDYIRDLTVAIAFDMLRRAILELSPIADYSYIKRTDSAVYNLRDLLN